MTISSLLFEAFTGLGGLLACAFLISAFVTETPRDRNGAEWTIGRRSGARRP